MNNTLTLTEEQMAQLQAGNPITIEPPKPKPKRYSDYAEKQQTNYMETSLIITGNHYRR
jgi:hypothetical protein